MTKNNRNILFDSIKGVLIILVILGHTIGVYNTDNFANTYVKNFIYLFHMPLFVIISGYFTNIDNKAKLFNTTIKLTETYLTFQLIYCIMNNVTIQNFFLKPNWILWYIFSLIIWRIIMYMIKSYNHIYTILLSVAISLLIGYCNLGYTLSLSRIIVFFPFFILGHYLRTNQSITKIREKRILRSLSIVVLVIISVSLSIFNYDLCFITRGSNPYYNSYEIIYRIAFFISAISLSFITYCITPVNKFIAYIGKNSLTFYLYHGLFIIILNKYILKYSLPIDLLSIIVYTAGILFLCYLFSNIKLFNKLILNPITSIMNRFTN